MSDSAEEVWVVLAGALVSYFGFVPQEIPSLDDEFWPWLRTNLPSTSGWLVDWFLRRQVESMLDAKVLAGELTAEAGPTGTVYRKVTA